MLSVHHSRKKKKLNFISRISNEVRKIFHSIKFHPSAINLILQTEDERKKKLTSLLYKILSLQKRKKKGLTSKQSVPYVNLSIRFGRENSSS